jgi:hypothetical protein
MHFEYPSPSTPPTPSARTKFEAHRADDNFFFITLSVKS